MLYWHRSDLLGIEPGTAEWGSNSSCVSQQRAILILLVIMRPRWELRWVLAGICLSLRSILRKLFIINSKSRKTTKGVPVLKGRKKEETNKLTKWLMQAVGSMPHSQGFSNNAYHEPNHSNSSYRYYFFKVHSNIVLQSTPRPSCKCIC